MYPTYKYFKRNYVHELALFIYETATLVLTYLLVLQTFILSLIHSFKSILFNFHIPGILLGLNIQ